MDEGDIKTLSGDFNAKVSNDKNDWNKVMRNHGIGKVNKNGELLADFVNRTKFTGSSDESHLVPNHFGLHSTLKQIISSVLAFHPQDRKK